MQEDNLNPASKFYDQETGHIGGENENSDNFNNRTSQDDLRNSELNPINYTGGGKNNILPAKGSKTSSKLTAVKKFKQFGPVVGLISTVFLGGGMMLMTAASPFLVLNHFTELVKEKLDYQDYINSERTDQLIKIKLQTSKMSNEERFKINDTIDIQNPANSEASKLTRFKKMSKVLIEKLENAGFVVNRTNEAELSKEYQEVNTLEFTQMGLEKSKVTINADNYDEIMNGNVAVRAAMNSAQRGQRSVQTDPASMVRKAEIGIQTALWTRGIINGLYKASKIVMNDIIDAKASNTKLGGDKFEQTKKFKSEIDENLKTGKDASGRAYSNAEKEALEEASEEISSGIKTNNRSVIKNKTVSPKVLKFLGGFSSAQDVCQYRDSIANIMKTRKLKTILNIARLAYFYATISDMVKAGNINGISEEELALAAEKFTVMRPTELGAETDVTKMSRTATDSLGYAYLEDRNNVQNLDDVGGESLNKFQAGAPLAASAIWDTFQGISDKLQTPCGIVKTPIGSATIKVVTIVAGIATLGATTITTKVIFEVVGSIVKSLTSTAFISFMIDEVFGVVTGIAFGSEVEGEDLGNAFATGMAHTLSQQSVQGGAGLMKKDDATAFLNGQRKFVAKKAEVIRYNSSPFDISTRHTFMGSIVSKMIPFMTKSTSIAGKIRLISSLSLNNLKNLIPKSQAMAESEAYATDQAYMNVCKDYEYTHSDETKDMAFTPFCTPITGIPKEVITSSDNNSIYDNPNNPLKIVERMVNLDKNIFNNNNNAVNNKSSFGIYIKSCVDRGNIPFGTDKTTYDPTEVENIDDIQNCSTSSQSPDDTTNSNNQLYAVFIADERAQCLLDDNKNCMQYGKVTDPSLTSELNSSNQTSVVNINNNLPMEGAAEDILVTSEFGERNHPITGELSFHYGIDLINTKYGDQTRILSVTEGTVTIPESQIAGCGENVIKVIGESGASLYCHMESKTVKTGDQVKVGDQVGVIGTRGHSTGVHLHLSVYDKNDTPFNPRNLSPLMKSLKAQ